MKTSVYLSNEALQVISGEDNGRTVKVKKCYKSAMPPGCIQNGVIVDNNGLAAALAEFFAHNKLPRHKVNLVLDCDAVMTKIIDVPITSDKKLRQIINGEFIGQGSEHGKLLVDYTVLEPSIQPAGGRVLGCAVEKDIIRLYLETFNRVAVELGNIDLALSCAIRFCSRVRDLKQKTYIVTVLKGTGITSLLFVNGIYCFSNRGKLFEKRGTPAAAVEISRTLSSLMQFNAAQKSEHAITNAFICGMQGDERDFCTDISSLLDIQVSIMPEWQAFKFGAQVSRQASVGDFIYCLGDIIQNK